MNPPKEPSVGHLRVGFLMAFFAFCVGLGVGHDPSLANLVVMGIFVGGVSFFVQRPTLGALVFLLGSYI